MFLDLLQTLDKSAGVTIIPDVIGVNMMPTQICVINQCNH